MGYCSPSRIDESNSVLEKSAIDGIQNSHLRESLDCEQKHDTNDDKTNDLSHVSLIVDIKRAFSSAT
jgi:hypothetical protein